LASGIPVYRNELAEMNRVRLVFLLMDLDTAEISLAIRPDTEIDRAPAALALLLGFRLIRGKLDLAVVLIAAVGALNGLLDDHEYSTYASSGPPHGWHGGMLL